VWLIASVLLRYTLGQLGCCLAAWLRHCCSCVKEVAAEPQVSCSTGARYYAARLACDSTNAFDISAMRIGAGFMAASQSATAYTHAATQNTGYGVERGSLYALHDLKQQQHHRHSQQHCYCAHQHMRMEDAAW
jgi:hypothetical protein